MQQDNIQEIIELAISGDIKSAGILYEKYLDPLYRFVYSRVRNKMDAEDIVQDVFVKFYKNLHELSSDERGLLPYLYTLARTTIIDFLKKKKPVLSDEMDYVADTSPNTLELSIKKEEEKTARDLLNALPLESREVVMMRYASELSYAEMSRILSKTEDSLRQIVSRAIKMMQEILKKDGKR